MPADIVESALNIRPNSRPFDFIWPVFRLLPGWRAHSSRSALQIPLAHQPLVRQNLLERAPVERRSQPGHQQSAARTPCRFLAKHPLGRTRPASAHAQRPRPWTPTFWRWTSCWLQRPAPPERGAAHSLTQELRSGNSSGLARSHLRRRGFFGT